jgi:hypothetical protein
VQVTITTGALNHTDNRPGIRPQSLPQEVGAVRFRANIGARADRIDQHIDRVTRTEKCHRIVRRHAGADRHPLGVVQRSAQPPQRGLRSRFDW